ncbi:MAG TPA: acyl-CoA thioesterase [Xanthomonadaceae bacterium]|jgi:acyl-CoA thioester hydrolase|nr:acyl-CoA thioesterase [Xanthomonadaceae bacterium]
MKTVFEFAMDVRWGDMDAFNHVNNASYLRYIEEARVAWFRALVPAAWADVDCAPILAAATMNYRRPIGWPERLRITLHAEKLGTKSLTLGHRIESATPDGVLYADGHTVMVWVDNTGASIALPPFIRAACED